MCGKSFAIDDNAAEERAFHANLAGSKLVTIAIPSRYWGILAFATSLSLLLVDMLATATPSAGSNDFQKRMLIAGAVLSTCSGALFFSTCCNRDYFNKRRERHPDYTCCSV